MRYSVILIDDEPMIINEIRRYIKWDELGYNVLRVFYDGKDALSFLGENRVDLVITDVEMTHVSGIDVCKYLHEHAPDTKIIILSAYEDFNYAIEALRYNVFDYILKTATLEEITEKLVRVQRKLTSSDSKIEIAEEQLWADIPDLTYAKNINNHLFINKALRYIQEHFEDDISLEAIAAHLYLTPSYFSKLFKTETGISFKQYIIKLKIDYSKQLLKDPKYKIYDISSKMGYKSEQFFSNVFKLHTGFTPLEYRKSIIPAPNKNRE